MKTRERIGPLKTNTGELVENGENMGQMLNDYFQFSCSLWNVIPIFKNGDKPATSNYRPISLTSVGVNYSQEHSGPSRKA